MRLATRRQLIAYGLLAPAFVLVLAWMIYPLWVVIETSLRLGRTANIARLHLLPLGADNYVRALGEEEVWSSAITTVIYSVGAVGPGFLIGLGLALLLDRPFPGRRWLRSLMLLPWAMPGVVAAIAFLWLFDSSFGVVNAGLRGLGLIDSDIAWFVDSRTAMPAVLLPTIWKCFPFFVLVLLAALQAVPQELHEAAKVDGATPWQRFRYVTWPCIRGAAALSLILMMLWAIKDFDLIYATTGGGPARATQTLSLLIYDEAFQFFRFGYASAIGMLLMVLCAVLAWLSLKWSRPPEGSR
jgi:multiple sugar transport system permease protein